MRVSGRGLVEVTLVPHPRRFWPVETRDGCCANRPASTAAGVAVAGCCPAHTCSGQLWREGMVRW
jgi:hypothetical protein